MAKTKKYSKEFFKKKMKDLDAHVKKEEREERNKENQKRNFLGQV